MTAEIGIMNRLGVALAADSAVTLGGEGGKIYTSADKLFQLTNSEPVGIMIYGSASLSGVPWETIVKCYRSDLNNTSFPRTADYANDFIRYIKNHKKLFFQAYQNKEAESEIEYIFSYIRNAIALTIQEAFDEEEIEEIPADDVASIGAQIIRETLHDLKSNPFYEGFNKSTQQVFRKQYSKVIQTVKKDIFQHFPISAYDSRNLTSLAIEFLTKRNSLPYTGIVISGFGTDEYVPAMLEIGIDGIINGKLRYSYIDNCSIDDNMISTVKPFAQREMVYSFMEGIDPNKEVFTKNTIIDLFFGFNNALLEIIEKYDNKLSSKIKSRLEPELDKMLDNLFDKWQEYSHENHWGPITSIVSSLPKDEIAGMAEALVNLTKFRRRISDQKETVGGPIDVAVITKGDGFVWVKRKHYFKAELNPRIMSKY